MVGTRALFPRRAELDRNYMDVLLVVIGAIPTFYLSNDLELGPVLSAGIIGTIASFLPQIRIGKLSMEQYPFSIYCGAFVGMSAGFVFSSYLELTIAALIAGSLFTMATNEFNGIGGKHGTIAFIGVLALKLFTDGI